MIDREKTIALVRGVQQGRDGAATELYQAFYSDIYYFILKNANNDPELAADLTQDTFMEILQTIQNLQEPAAFFKWSHQIAYHRCTAYFRKRHELLADEDEEGYSVFDTLQEEREEFIPGEALEKEELKKIVYDMLRQLPEEQRSALILRYFNEMSVKDIADIQGVSEGTVKSRLNYGRKSMKQAVESYEKRSGIKLHCAGIIPLLLWLFREYRLSKKISLTAQFSAGALKEKAASAMVKTAAEVTRSAVEGATRRAAEVRHSGEGIKAAKRTAKVLSSAAEDSDTLSTAAEVGGEVVKEAGKEGLRQTAKAVGKAGAKTAAKAVGKTLATKIIAGVTAATLVTGGAVAAPKIIETIQESSSTSQSQTQKQEEKEPKINEDNILLSGYEFADEIDFRTVKIIFTDTEVPEDVETIDVSANHSGGVVAWFVETEEYDAGYFFRYDAYEMYVTSIDGGTIYANEDSRGMFALVTTDDHYGYCEYIQEIVFDNFDTSLVTDMSEMFRKLSWLKSLDLTGFNTSNVTNMSGMFSGCENMVSLEAGNWDVSKVTDMSHMFSSCNKLRKLELNKWDVSSVKHMMQMFEYCYGLQEISVSNWNTKNVTNMEEMFLCCRSIKEIDLSNWNTSKVEDMSGMFQSCESMTELDLSKWNISSVSNMQYLFLGCDKLRTIYAADWTTQVSQPPANCIDMFYSCIDLVGAVTYGNGDGTFAMANPTNGYFKTKS